MCSSWAGYKPGNQGQDGAPRGQSNLPCPRASAGSWDINQALCRGAVSQAAWLARGLFHLFATWWLPASWSPQTLWPAGWLISFPNTQGVPLASPPSLATGHWEDIHLLLPLGLLSWPFPSCLPCCGIPACLSAFIWPLSIPVPERSGQTSTQKAESLTHRACFHCSITPPDGHGSTAG